MVCFVAGTVISLLVDSILFTLTDGLINVPAGLATDAIAISLLLAVPQVRQPFRSWVAARWRVLRFRPARLRALWRRITGGKLNQQGGDIAFPLFFAGSIRN